jgi:hypothetical protein
MLRIALGFAAVLLAACTAGQSGQDACVAAGGQCLAGGYHCGYVGPQDCNPDRSPGGWFCCLGCPNGTTPAPDDAGIACIGDGGDSG